MARELPSTSADYYQRMLTAQTNTKTLVAEKCTLQKFLDRESQQAVFAYREMNPLPLHDMTYGRRVVESFEEAQKGESEAYYPAVAQEHIQNLDRISAQQYLEQMRLHGCLTGDSCRVIDLCCGSGNIIVKIIAQATDEERAKLQCLGIDFNADAVKEAQERFADAPSVQVQKGDVLNVRGVQPANVVICQTSMHGFEEPHRLLHVARGLAQKLVVVKDFLRPEVLNFWPTVRIHGQHYRGRMFQLFCESLKSSLTPREMQALALREGFTYEDCPPIYGMLTWVQGAQSQQRTRPSS